MLATNPVSPPAQLTASQHTEPHRKNLLNSNRKLPPSNFPDTKKGQILASFTASALLPSLAPASVLLPSRAKFGTFKI